MRFQIAGAPAETSDESNGRIVELFWGPVDGWVFRGVAAHSSIDEAKAVAEQMRVIDGKVTVLDPTGEPADPFGPDQAGYLDRVGVRLPYDVEQHRFASVRRDDRLVTGDQRLGALARRDDVPAGALIGVPVSAGTMNSCE